MVGDRSLADSVSRMLVRLVFGLAVVLYANAQPAAAFFAPEEDESGTCNATFNVCAYEYGLPVVCGSALLNGVALCCGVIGGEAMCDPIYTPGPMFVNCGQARECDCDKWGDSCTAKPQ
jgi:hypothetical protein